MTNWSPFSVAPDGARGAKNRSISTPEGLGDRLRSAAFAELQATYAFEWALGRFADVPQWLSSGWERVIIEERKHLGWLLARMETLGVDPAERAVSIRLWNTLKRSASAGEFCYWITEAEEWGRKAANAIAPQIMARDPETAAIFEKIAEEERFHVALGKRFAEISGYTRESAHGNRHI